jgi:formamidopyrimidine-DNA glycosylase
LVECQIIISCFFAYFVVASALSRLTVEMGFRKNAQPRCGKEQRMPELPEVETVVADLKSAGLVGRTIRRVVVRWPKTVAHPAVGLFARRLRGRQIKAVSRRAKFIRFALSDGSTLLAHLRMTGQFHFAPSRELPDPHDRLVLTLDDGRELRFRDTRKFGRWHLVSDPAAVIGHLGPEPLEARFRQTDFDRRLAGRMRRLKPLLLDQRILAGIGNIYADEALWAARLHPLRRAATLSADERRTLYGAIRRVLRQAIAHAGTSLGDGKGNFRRGRYQNRLRVYGRAGAPCPRCRAPIARLVVGQRATHICPRCQRLNRKRAERQDIPAFAQRLRLGKQD